MISGLSAKAFAFILILVPCIRAGSFFHLECTKTQVMTEYSKNVNANPWNGQSTWTAISKWYYRVIYFVTSDDNKEIGEVKTIFYEDYPTFCKSHLDLSIAEVQYSLESDSIDTSGDYVRFKFRLPVNFKEINFWQSHSWMKNGKITIPLKSQKLRV